MHMQMRTRRRRRKQSRGRKSRKEYHQCNAITSSAAGGDPLQSAPCLLLQINQQGQGVMPPIVVVVAQDGSWRAAASASMPERCCRSTSQERQLSSTHTPARALCGSRAPLLPRASSSTRRLEIRLSDRLPVRLHLRHIRSRAGHRRGTQAAEGLKDTRQDSTERHEGGKYHRSSCNHSRRIDRAAALPGEDSC